MFTSQLKKIRWFFRQLYICRRFGEHFAGPRERRDAAIQRRGGGWWLVDDCSGFNFFPCFFWDSFIIQIGESRSKPTRAQWNDILGFCGHGSFDETNWSGSSRNIPRILETFLKVKGSCLNGDTFSTFSALRLICFGKRSLFCLAMNWVSQTSQTPLPILIGVWPRLVVISFCFFFFLSSLSHRIRMYAILMVCHLPSIYPKFVSIWIPYIRIRHGYIHSCLCCFISVAKVAPNIFLHSASAMWSFSKCRIGNPLFMWGVSQMRLPNSGWFILKKPIKISSK